jgi:hypothetical protein
MQPTKRQTTTAVFALVLALGGSARARAPSEPSPRRRQEIRTTLAKRRGLKARQHARAAVERSAIARADRAMAEAQATYLRANPPTYAAVTRDGRWQVKDAYLRMPDGSTSFRTVDGYVRDTQMITAP